MTQSRALAPADLNRLASLGHELRELLAAAKRSVDAEIGAYPTPIPRCDAQFNHLYEQRSRIAQSLARIGDALERGDAADALVRALVAFASAAPLGDHEDERSLRERLRADLVRFDASFDPDHARRDCTPVGPKG